MSSVVQPDAQDETVIVRRSRGGMKLASKQYGNRFSPTIGRHSTN